MFTADFCIANDFKLGKLEATGGILPTTLGHGSMESTGDRRGLNRKDQDLWVPGRFRDPVHWLLGRKVCRVVCFCDYEYVMKIKLH